MNFIAVPYCMCPLCKNTDGLTKQKYYQTCDYQQQTENNTIKPTLIFLMCNV